MTGTAAFLFAPSTHMPSILLIILSTLDSWFCWCCCCKHTERRGKRERHRFFCLPDFLYVKRVLLSCSHSFRSLLSLFFSFESSVFPLTESRAAFFDWIPGLELEWERKRMIPSVSWRQSLQEMETRRETKELSGLEVIREEEERERNWKRRKREWNEEKRSSLLLQLVLWSKEKDKLKAHTWQFRTEKVDGIFWLLTPCSRFHPKSEQATHRIPEIVSLLLQCLLLLLFMLTLKMQNACPSGADVTRFSSLSVSRNHIVFVSHVWAATDATADAESTFAAKLVERRRWWGKEWTTFIYTTFRHTPSFWFLVSKRKTSSIAETQKYAGKTSDLRKRVGGKRGGDEKWVGNSVMRTEADVNGTRKKEREN